MVFSAENALDVLVRVLVLSIGFPAAAFFALAAFHRARPKGCAANRYLSWISVSVMCVALPSFAFADAFAHRHVTNLDVVTAAQAQDVHFRFEQASPIAASAANGAHATVRRIEPSNASSAAQAVPILAVLAVVWFAGALLLLLRLACRLRLALGLKRGTPFDAYPKSTRGASVVVSDAVASPVAIGYLRPAIVLPRALEAPGMSLIREHALAHENAHLRRYDDVTALLYQFCVALAWMNPIVWLIAPFLDAEREKACDDAVILQTRAAREYGRSLLALCGASVFARPQHVLALFESPQRLTERIEALMTKRPRSLQPHSGTAALCLAVILVQSIFAATVTPGFALAESMRLVDLPALSQPRADHVAVLLNDGNVLIAGGMLENGKFLKSAELYVPKSREFETVGDMNLDRAGASAVTLPNGKVLVTGGWTSAGLTRTTEIYDPLTRSFRWGPLMHSARGSETATLLRDGHVLVAGGWGIGKDHFNDCSELYDWRTNRFTEGSRMWRPRGEHTATLLQDGTVLLAGGSSEGMVTLRSAEIYNPLTNRFSPAGDMLEPRTKHSATLLPDGRVLLAGGGTDYTWHHVQSSAEIFDPRSRSFAAISGMSQPRFKDSQSTVALADGSVLFAGGADNLERFDPRASRFITLGGHSAIARHLGTATVLRDGSVLLAGGYGNNALTTASSQLILLR